MRSKHLSVALLAASLACAGAIGLANEAAHGKPARAMSGVTDEQAVEHAMKALFDKPQSPLKVAAVSVEGDYALAGWIQDQRGGRALLKKDQVAKFAMFDGVVKVDGAGHGAHAAGHAAVGPPK